jgi:hypothetical protein
MSYRDNKETMMGRPKNDLSDVVNYVRFRPECQRLLEEVAARERRTKVSVVNLAVEEYFRRHYGGLTDGPGSESARRDMIRGDG